MRKFQTKNQERRSWTWRRYWLTKEKQEKFRTKIKTLITLIS